LIPDCSKGNISPTLASVVESTPHNHQWPPTVARQYTEVYTVCWQSPVCLDSSYGQHTAHYRVSASSIKHHISTRQFINTVHCRISLQAQYICCSNIYYYTFSFYSITL